LKRSFPPLEASSRVRGEPRFNVEDIMPTIREQVCTQLDSRLEEAVAADNGASTVLAGVLAEFRRKFAKTVGRGS
jgi:hypothetical protein